MNKYKRVIDWVFQNKYIQGAARVQFSRAELVEAHDTLSLSQSKNIGDIPYTFRFRSELPESILSTAPAGKEWIIEGTGIGEYQFRLAEPGKIEPTSHHLPIKVPDATPEIVKLYATGTDEQALLTRVRYNRIIDIFTGLTCYSIQNHLRTTIEGIGQVEVDEIYIGINKQGTHFVLPCQAKSRGDKFGIVQVLQDMALCKERYPFASCKPIALQFVTENQLAVLELTVRDDEDDEVLKFNIVDEKQYVLVPKSEM